MFAHRTRTSAPVVAALRPDSVLSAQFEPLSRVDKWLVLSDELALRNVRNWVVSGNAAFLRSSGKAASLLLT